MHMLHGSIAIAIILQMQQFGLFGSQENSHGLSSSSDRDGFKRRHIPSLVVPPLSILLNDKITYFVFFSGVGLDALPIQ
jgi:hypothetical protein